MQIERAPHHPDDDDDDDFFPLTRRHTQMRQLPFAFIPSRSADAQKKQKEKKVFVVLFRFNFPDCRVHRRPHFTSTTLAARLCLHVGRFFGIEKLIFLLFLRRPFLF